jgi:hypothetical protein
MVLCLLPPRAEALSPIMAVTPAVMELLRKIKFIDTYEGAFALILSATNLSRYLLPSGTKLFESNATILASGITLFDSELNVASIVVTNTVTISDPIEYKSGDERLHLIADDLLVRHAATAQCSGNVVNRASVPVATARAASALFRLAGSLINDRLRGDCSRTVRPRCMHTLGVSAVRDCQ